MAVQDINGLELNKGDVVSPLTGNLTGRICDVREEGDADFVCVRPSHRPYSKGVWYAADRVQRLQIGKTRKRRNDEESAKSSASGKGGSAKRTDGSGGKSKTKRSTASSRSSTRKTARRPARKAG